MDKQVLYIAGRGHSGSTLLDIVLSQLLDFRSCGELLSGMMRLDAGRCTCGEQMTSCREWKIAEHQQLLGNNDLFDGIRQRGRFSRIPDALFGLNKHIVALHEETSYLHSLCGDKNGMVDSSKEISRSLFLSRGPAGAFVVHLIRHPQALIVSARQRVSRGVVIKINRRDYHWPTQLLLVLDFFICLSWVVSSAMLFILNFTRREQYCIVEYDSFVNDPINTAESIALRMKLPEVDEIRNRTSDNQYTVGHLAGGNRMASTAMVSITPKKGKAKIGFFSKVVYYLVAAIPYHLMKRSKYNVS